MTRSARVTTAALTVAVAIATVFAGPARAEAHGVGGVKPTNYSTEITNGTPAISGVTVAMVDLGERVELTNRGTSEITVVGYQDEPYLRIGPDGVFENVRSPATFINRTLIPTDTVPRAADPGAPAEWRKISDEPVARWHDHRAHWMGPTPEIVRNDPETARVLTDWSIPLLVDGAPGPEITGTIRWEPSTPYWPWVLGALLGAALIAALSRTHLWRVTWTIALVGVGSVAGVIVTGAWRFSTYGFAKQLFANIYNLASFAVAVAALWFVLRRDRIHAAPIVLIAGLVALFGTGLPGFLDLSAPFIPTTFPVGTARAAVAAALALGCGLAIGAAQFLRISGTRTHLRTTTSRKSDSEEEQCPPEAHSQPSPSASPPSW